jgi:spermidine synthase
MKIDIDVPDGISGEWRVETFEVQEKEISQIISMFKTGRGVPAGMYKRLMRNNTCVMSNTPDEISDCMHFVCKARGSILVNGLGLGVLLKALLSKDEVTDITVIEKSEDVIKLVAPTYLVDNRVTIVKADAFQYKPPKDKIYYAVWHDIWDYISADNLEEMKKLHRKYGRKAGYQESWCRWMCEKANKRY